MGSFHVLATENSTAMNIGVHVSLQISVCFLFQIYIYPVVELLNHVVVLISVFKGTFIV